MRSAVAGAARTHPATYTARAEWTCLRDAFRAIASWQSTRFLAPCPIFRLAPKSDAGASGSPAFFVSFS